MTEANKRHDMAGQASVTLGARLRKRRVELGWSLEQVESYLKMRHATLQAIESERYADLPDKVYAFGFIKSYAHFLGLDVANVMEQAERELASLVPKRHTMQLDLPGPQEGRSAGLWLLLGVGLIVIAGGYVGWYHFYSHGELGSSILPAHMTSEANAPQAVEKKAVATVTSTSETQSQQLATVSPPVGATSPQEGAQKVDESAKDTPDIPPAPEALPSSTEGSSSFDKEGQAVANGPVTSVQTTSPTQGPAEQKPVDVPSTAAQPVAATPAQKPVVQPSQPAQSVEDAVSIVAREDSWVQVSDSTGKVLFAKVLKPGETWQGTAGASYRITCGNAGGVVFQTGNVVSAPLGQRGRVVRNLTVDAIAITQGHYGYGSPLTGASPAAAAH